MGSKILRQLRKAFTSVSPIMANHIMYYAIMKRKLNLKAPQTLNEKINWLKLNVFPYDERIIKCTDKVLVHDYIKSKGLGHILNKLYGVWEKPEDINWDELPDKFVLKCNHGCGYNIICTDKSKLDVPATIKQLNKWLREDYWRVSCEPHYKGIKRKILCEEYLQDEIVDYKFLCFNGSPETFYVAKYIDGDFHNARLAHMTPDGEYADFQRADRKVFDEKPPLPEQIGEMLEIAKKLSEDFHFVRVDLFNVNGKIHFSELTFSPCSGMMPLTPFEADIKLGQLIDLNRYCK